MLKVKHGVTPSNLVIAAAAANTASDLDLTIFITSGTDGKHMVKSKHYIGAALDFRISNLTKDQIKEFLTKLQTRLGKKYQVILEKDHIHAEFDPD